MGSRSRVDLEREFIQTAIVGGCVGSVSNSSPKNLSLRYIRLKKYAPNMHPNLNRPNNIFPKCLSEGKLPEPPQGIECRPTDWWTIALQGYLRRCSANKCHALNDWSRRRDSNPRPTIYETIPAPYPLFGVTCSKRVRVPFIRARDHSLGTNMHLKMPMRSPKPNQL